MQFNLKNYQIHKTKKQLKNDFLFLAIGANQSSQNLINVSQNLHELNLSYYKIYNNTTIKLLKNSVYQNLFKTLNTTLFFIKPQRNDKLLTKNNLANTLKNIFFTLLIIKLDKKMYLITQLKSLRSLNYMQNVAMLYQFLLLNLKFSVCFQKKIH